VDADRQTAVQRRRVRRGRRRELARQFEDVAANNEPMRRALLEESPREGVEVDEEDPVRGDVERQRRPGGRPGQKALDRARDRRERERRF